MMGCDSPQRYGPQQVLARLSLKVAGCTPDQLPPYMLVELQSQLEAVSGLLMHGYLRPGCTHLGLELLLPAAATPATRDSSRSSLGKVRSKAAELLNACLPAWQHCLLCWPTYLRARNRAWGCWHVLHLLQWGLVFGCAHVLKRSSSLSCVGLLYLAGMHKH